MRVLTGAIGKPAGGVRPIAMGETLRRLAAKCLHSAVLDKVSEYLLPLQVGVQVPNAAELVARRVKLWAKEAAPGEVLLQVDLRNSFNSLDRNAMLAEVQARARHCCTHTR